MSQSEIEIKNLKHEKQVLDNQITTLVQRFEERMGLEIVGFKIVRIEGYGGKKALMGIQTTIEL